MKKIIIIGTILACFLMLMTPNISAVEINTVVQEQKTVINNQINKIEKQVNIFKNKIKHLTNKIENNYDNTDLLFNIILNGIVFPIILYTLSKILFNILIANTPILASIITLISSFIIPFLTLLPMYETILEETGSVLLATIIYFFLGYFDIFVGGKLGDIIYPI